MKKTADPTQIAFGDWQTPAALAEQIVLLLRKQKISPRTIVEPTCGKGAFIQASVKAWKNVCRFGFDVNSTYVKIAQTQLGDKATIKQQNFFAINWDAFFAKHQPPFLVLGNPPWVTSAELSVVNATTLPPKFNRKKPGYEAITGKANFDVSEAIMIKLLNKLTHKDFHLAFLCKTTVARKVIEHISANSWKMTGKLHQIDAKKHFSAMVDAVLFSVQPTTEKPLWPYYKDLEAVRPAQFIEYHNGQITADPIAYKNTERFMGKSLHQWRSGIKHDCARVMEFQQTNEGLQNRFGCIDLETNFIYPLLKGSDVANRRWPPSKMLLVPQQFVGESTAKIAEEAPKTWKYLNQHKTALENRKSRIYENKPMFSIFGVGPYAFAPWKVAIAGLYKKLSFWVVGPYQGKPVVFDDTTYFLSFQTKKQAEKAYRALTSETATRFFNARIFWPAKRPITKQILQALVLQRLYVEEKN